MSGTAQHPKQIGPYRILGVLGEGGMGRVYRAEQSALGREVALKVMMPSLMARKEVNERFLREARAAAGINHPNVITCFDVGQEKGMLYMALELVTGGDCSQLLKSLDGQLGEDRALSIVRDAATGLAPIEAAGLIHRDIKPANIFLTQRGSAKLADLGLVRDTVTDDQLTSPGVPVGTPAYMSPEQAGGQSDVDIRSDICSLGATLYCLLVGRPPFSGETPIHTIMAVLNKEPPDPSKARTDLSPATVELIARAMAKDRAGRFQTSMAMVQACEAALAALERGGAVRRGTESYSSGGHSRPPEVGSPQRDKTPAKEDLAAAPTGGEPMTTARVEREMGLDRRQLLKLATRIHVSEDGLQAWIHLAPGTHFPRVLLDKLLDVAEVIYGIQNGALNDATRTSDRARRLVIAVGDPPTPGVRGCDVRGKELAPHAEPVLVRVAPDQMSAVALFRPGVIPSREATERAVRTSGMCFGIDAAAVQRLWKGPADHSGRVRISAGIVMREGEPAGFRMAQAVADQSLTGGEVRNLAEVQAGVVLAVWQDADPGRAGMNIFGHKVDPPPLPALTPDGQAGPGTEIVRGRDGTLSLRSTLPGYVQQRHDGMIRVVTAVEVKGDLGPNDAPIETDDVVVVRGSVMAGAKISCGADVVIMGDLADAHIEAGGSIEIHGDILAGDAPVMTPDQLSIDGTCVRKVVAGSLKIAGAVEHCELVSTGDIHVQRVVGGRLTAAGSVICDYAGDERGTTTELLAGQHAGYEDQAQMARLAERRLASERASLQRAVQQMGGELGTMQRKQARFDNAAYVNEGMLSRQRRMLEELEARQGELESEAEAARARLAQQRGVLKQLKNLSADADAAVEVRVLARRGVIAGVAGSDPVKLRRDEQNYRLDLKSE
ncbi:MAG: FapA family protein [Planctomycetota bacterium]|nr:FapA family protein [Planctomycetota bacterium]